uniref:SET domain-containing protein n=1 Tax=Phaeomonas parva TaxID=124430 RepID=A0A6U4E636_9STRA|mmetsp:Transcript_19713/g.59706  ORF Transcript_19713/g.59706 Transcript_19713/m.59706 type:complete len:204 (+) Transcript_19713:491-1102(+)
MVTFTKAAALVLAAAAGAEGFSSVVRPTVPLPAAELVHHAAGAEARPGVHPDCHSMVTARERGCIEVRCAGERGLGVFATEDIPIHTDLGDFYGELMSAQQVAARYKGKESTPEDEAWRRSRVERNQGLTGDYLVQAGEVFICVEDTDMSGWTRFVNHDEPGNCRLKILPKGMGGKPRAWLVAGRDIAAGEEVTFSYGDHYEF